MDDVLNLSGDQARPVRLAIVDDSAVMRALIRQRVEATGLIEVVGEAGDPIEARELIKRTDPDVLTLDIEMPKMDGLTFLEKLMRLRPMPVVMVSSLTAEGGATTLSALSLGAVDYALKPRSGELAFADLPEKILVAARSRLKPRPRANDAEEEVRLTDHTTKGTILALGASTGGVDALQTILRKFPKDCPPTVIVQHMPGAFTSSFAARLDRNCAPKVQEAMGGERLERGHIYLAPGSEQHLVVEGGATPRCALKDGAPVSGHRPSVDVLFESLTRHAHCVVAGLLTGMGRDGAAGLKSLRDKGARTLVQDEATSVVFGMPRAALACQAASRAIPLGSIAKHLLAGGPEAGVR